ncbi:MAG: hypothetical protein IPO98_19100 [Saprospiraceae bacterium]|nr:hypothetical protein [Saprospiraceae bacterium]
MSSIKYKSDGNGAGNRIHIIDDAGYKHSYFHLSDHNFGINLSSGGRVTKGQKLVKLEILDDLVGLTFITKQFTPMELK